MIIIIFSQTQETLARRDAQRYADVNFTVMYRVAGSALTQTPHAAKKMDRKGGRGIMINHGLHADCNNENPLSKLWIHFVENIF